MGKIKCVIFDFGGVLGTGSYNRFLQKMMNINPSHKFVDLFKKAFATYKIGGFDEDGFWMKLLTKESMELVQKHQKQKFSSKEECVNFLKKKFRAEFNVQSAMYPILKYLESNGIILGILTNHSKTWFNEMIVCDDGKMKKFFKDEMIVNSYLVKCCKPFEKIYKITLDRVMEEAEKKNIEVSPSEVLFVDDKKNNIESAIKAGFSKDSIIFNVRLNDVKEFEKKIKLLV